MTSKLISIHNINYQRIQLKTSKVLFIYRYIMKILMDWSCGKQITFKCFVCIHIYCMHKFCILLISSISMYLYLRMEIIKWKLIVKRQRIVRFRFPCEHLAAPFPSLKRMPLPVWTIPYYFRASEESMFMLEGVILHNFKLQVICFIPN